MAGPRAQKSAALLLAACNVQSIVGSFTGKLTIYRDQFAPSPWAVQLREHDVTGVLP